MVWLWWIVLVLKKWKICWYYCVKVWGCYWLYYWVWKIWLNWCWLNGFVLVVWYRVFSCLMKLSWNCCWKMVVWFVWRNKIWLVKRLLIILKLEKWWLNWCLIGSSVFSLWCVMMVCLSVWSFVMSCVIKMKILIVKILFSVLMLILFWWLVNW